jgi:glycosyltransferase involved in cell wall biosynthesis
MKGGAELHVVNWVQRKSLAGMRYWGSVTEQPDWYGTRHDITLAPNFHRLVLRRTYPPQAALWLNQRLFGSAVRRIVERARPACSVVSVTHQWTGYPPFDSLRPVIFDHVDRAVASVEDEYVRRSDVVVAVSEALIARHRDGTRPAAVLTNGVNLSSYRQLDRLRSKAALGLDGRTVVSLIGLTCSPRLYFVDAVKQLEHAYPSLSLLVVGAGAMLAAIKERARALGLSHLVAPGHVPSSAVATYFAASDVGLYPGDVTPWFLDAAPLKIIEYSACGVPVVTSPVRMFRSGWPNVVTVDATKDALAAGIRAALDEPSSPPDLSEFDWQHIATRFMSVLSAACRESEARA